MYKINNSIFSTIKKHNLQAFKGGYKDNKPTNKHLEAWTKSKNERDSYTTLYNSLYNSPSD